MATSTSPLTAEIAPSAVVRSPGEWRRAARYLRRDVKVILGFMIIGLLLLMAFLAPLLTPYDPNAQEYELLLPPSAQHLLGTDEFGRDLLSRLIAGSRVSLLVGFAAVSLAVLASVPLGLLAGYYGGWIDNIIMRYIDLQWAFPSLIIAVGLMAILGPGVGNVIIAVSLAYVDDFARLARGEVLALREEEFITASRATGSSDFRIIVRHLLPNSLSPLIVQATISISYAILAESTLSFLGLGVPITTPTWGLILSGSRGFFTMAWWLAIFPGLAIMVTVLSINFVGDGLRDALDVKVSRVD
ncbi:ABC transporter permease [Candidatus Entotheonella palauensis]|uniref:ABC transporter permease n=1 Tax=Candidatus Entotheonella palauensis TaxID=93172 RepID=UPI001178485C|nr:ABC transporter permease [Candidatus Entotheonella palauensis]